ncbi:hypothetical protein [Caminibacter pacificus]
MRFFLIFLFVFSFLKADILKDFFEKKYNNLCTYQNIQKYKDENILSLIGFSCVKLDKIYLLPFITNKLKKTDIGRKNSIYFSTIYLQKKLLMAYFFDNYSLDGFSFPKSDYILSVIFDKIKNHKYEKIGNIYIIDNGDIIYNIFKKEDKIVIDEIKGGKVIKKHWFR